MTDMRTWTTPEGWYPDPEQPGQQIRYWDGEQWTQQTAPMVVQSPPMPPPAPTGSRPAFYKRPWFIAVAVVLVLAAIFGGQEDPGPAVPVAATADDAATTDDASADDAEAETAAEPVAASVAVPDVVGLDEPDATAELEDAGLDVRREDVEGAKEGEVVQQSPAAGREVDEGTTVTVAVATGVVSVEIPDVTGMKLAAGREVLRGDGFKVDVSKIEDDSVPVGEIVEQSPTGEAEAGDTISLVVAKAPKPQLTSGQENALRSAEDYLGYSAFSRKGLIEQLEYEGYSTKDATFAVDHVTVNWNEQAAQSAKDYLEYSPFSRQGLIEQLEYEGFTHEQATYGVDKAM